MDAMFADVLSGFGITVSIHAPVMDAILNSPINIMLKAVSIHAPVMDAI